MSFDAHVMPLGEHLEELRGRVFRIVLVMVAAMIAAMSLHGSLLPLFLRPLEVGAGMISDETLEALGQDSRAELAQLYNRSMTEGPVSIMRIALYSALMVTFPYVLYQLWGFVSPGLLAAERRFAFMLIPLAAIFFYGGIIFGYFLGLPYLMRFLFEFNAGFNTGVRFELQQADYYSFFFMMCLLFGLLMDIPWAVMLLVRTGLVKAATIAKRRKHIYFVTAALSALMTPPDPLSLLMVWGLAIALFESGLFASRFMARHAAETGGVAAPGDGRSAPLEGIELPDVTPNGLHGAPETTPDEHGRHESYSDDHEDEHEDEGDDEGLDYSQPVPRPTAFGERRSEEGDVDYGSHTDADEHEAGLDDADEPDRDDADRDPDDTDDEGPRHA